MTDSYKEIINAQKKYGFISKNMTELYESLNMDDFDYSPYDPYRSKEPRRARRV